LLRSQDVVAQFPLPVSLSGKEEFIQDVVTVDIFRQDCKPSLAKTSGSFLSRFFSAEKVMLTRRLSPLMEPSLQGTAHSG
jgi:hypothetical protein